MMDALHRNYPAAANDSKLPMAITRTKNRRDKRRNKSQPIHRET